ncbi:hypothetical protein DQP56_00345 [Mycolicibacter senuensis]|uniref:Uncharacterized protein n=1 Tax=Mycolicibacter longobardus TaxID=1108812 RepID=A0A1X1YAF5_9MYCO|nr:hypothetical protein AWC16_20125 [Mycolicibacter longobardus]RAV04303.1 hypothetical protein DQP56_00345 [Mycolicibacter senuensis]
MNPGSVPFELGEIFPVRISFAVPDDLHHCQVRSACGEVVRSPGSDPLHDRARLRVLRVTDTVTGAQRAFQAVR